MQTATTVPAKRPEVAGYAYKHGVGAYCPTCAKRRVRATRESLSRDYRVIRPLNRYIAGVMGGGWHCQECGVRFG